MMVNFQPVDTALLAPVEFNWTCPYCKRGFVGQAPKMFAPAAGNVKKLVCSDCELTYNARVEENYQLKPEAESAARTIGQMPECDTKKLTLATWEKLSTLSSLFNRIKYRAMLVVANKQMPGSNRTNQPKGWQRR